MSPLQLLSCCSFCLQWQVTYNTNQSIHQSNVDGIGRSIEGSDFSLIDQKEAHPSGPILSWNKKSNSVEEKSLQPRFSLAEGSHATKVAYLLLTQQPMVQISKIPEFSDWFLIDVLSRSKRKKVNGHIVQFSTRVVAKLVRSSYQMHSFSFMCFLQQTLHYIDGAIQSKYPWRYSSCP